MTIRDRHSRSSRSKLSGSKSRRSSMGSSNQVGIATRPYPPTLDDHRKAVCSLRSLGGAPRKPLCSVASVTPPPGARPHHPPPVGEANNQKRSGLDRFTCSSNGAPSVQCTGAPCPSRASSSAQKGLKRNISNSDTGRSRSTYDDSNAHGNDMGSSGGDNSTLEAHYYPGFQSTALTLAQAAAPVLARTPTKR